MHTGTLGRGIAGNLAGYVETLGVAPHATGSRYQALGSAGLGKTLCDDWIIDAGLTFGLSDSSDDFGAFIGTSYRFSVLRPRLDVEAFGLYLRHS